MPEFQRCITIKSIMRVNFTCTTQLENTANKLNSLGTGQNAADDVAVN